MLKDDNALRRDRNFIAGSWVSAGSGAVEPVLDPASGEKVGEVPISSAQDAHAAVDAACKGLETMRGLTAAERADLLFALHDRVLDHKEALAELLTAEQGKPLVEARAEIGMSAAYLRWYAEEARRLYGRTIPSPWPDRELVATHQPVGVVAAITPWNFPSSMLARKIAPALAAGCSVVAKPAPQTPLSALAWGALAEEAGLPAGALNIVTGPAEEIGDVFLSREEVRKLTFTGSTGVGKLLLARAAATVKKVSMELGGNAPFLVFDDADLDRSVDGAIDAKFRNTGQTCVCANRVLVQDGIYDDFVERLAEKAAALKVGPGKEPGVEQGPMIDEAALGKVEDMVADALEKGGRIVTGGRRVGPVGRFFEPTVIADAKGNMRCASEEIFGPVAPVFRFSSETEGVAQANATEFGLAAYAYTRDLGRAHRVAASLDYGIVGINEGIVTTEVAPFGGTKHSGLGREGGTEGITDYLETKYVCYGGLG